MGYYRGGGGGEPGGPGGRRKRGWMRAHYGLYGETVPTSELLSERSERGRARASGASGALRSIAEQVSDRATESRTYFHLKVTV